MEVAFETDRFRVFKGAVDLSPYYSPRTLYVAFPLDDDIAGVPMQLSSALVVHNLDKSHFVDWLETSENVRRKGIARELLLGIMKDLKGSVIATGVTEAGIALEESLERSDL